MLARYPDVFTPRVLAMLANFDPHDVFCRNGMSWVAGGVMWATIDARGVLRIAIINR